MFDPSREFYLLNMVLPLLFWCQQFMALSTNEKFAQFHIIVLRREGYRSLMQVFDSMHFRIIYPTGKFISLNRLVIRKDIPSIETMQCAMVEFNLPICSSNQVV